MSELHKVLEDIKAKVVSMGIEIENTRAKLDSTRRDLKDCTNELCMLCGQYQTAHLGSCEGCRWLAVKEGFR